MNSFIQKLLTFTFKKQCPDIKMIETLEDIITVHYVNGKKSKFKVSLTHIKEGDK